MARMRQAMHASRMFQPGAPQILKGCPIARTSPVAGAAIVQMGDDDGSLAFVPKELTVKSGETVQFVNNAGFPHNVVFDDEAGMIPAGVDAEKLSQIQYLNAVGQSVSIKFDKKGEYNYYCENHEADGMKGKIFVK